MITKVTPSIAYAGVDDTSIQLFENQYAVPDGMSYNSYVILDDKIAILDTVDARMASQWLENITTALDGRTPDYLVVHHMEPDHSGEIITIMNLYPDLKIVASRAAVKMLPCFCGGEDYAARVVMVGDGSTLTLGRHTLRFFNASMIHWPEVIMSYEETTGTLFSADAFGRFGAVGPDLFKTDDWETDARRYYYNIVGKYGAQVQSLLKKIAGLSITRVCSLHGPVLSGDLSRFMEKYDCWSRYQPEVDGVFIPYGSIYGGTEQAAMALAKILVEKGIENVETFDLARGAAYHAVADAFRFKVMVVAGASYDADLFPPVYDFLHKLSLKNYNQRSVGLIENGSWAPTAAKVMKSQLIAMRSITLLEPVVTVRSRLADADIPALEALADSVISALR